MHGNVSLPGVVSLAALEIDLWGVIVNDSEQYKLPMKSALAIPRWNSCFAIDKYIIM